MILLFRQVLLIAAGVLATSQLVYSQASTQSNGSFDFNTDGVVFQNADSSTRVLMRFRMQNWATYTTKSMELDEDLDLSAGSTDFAVRRLRLRFGGSLYDPRLTFNLQLSFSRSDQDWTDTQFPNVVRDAMIFWNFSPNLQVGFGQTKLPGNRQRVISSADLEQPDRSIVNGAFNLDRDFGFQGFWRPLAGSVIVNLRAAVTSGEGRNQPRMDGGSSAVTCRAEVLPLGSFSNGGDYFEGDLAREQTPKISIGLTYHHNNNHTRTRGTIGPLLYERRSSEVLYADALAKYQGFSLYGEYAQRTGANPVTYKDSTKTDYAAVFVGSGYLLQASYVFPSMWSISVRYAIVNAGDQLVSTDEYRTRMNLSSVIGYYINKHRIKAGLELGADREIRHNAADLLLQALYARFNVELGI